MATKQRKSPRISTSNLLKSSLKLGASRKQTLLVLFGVIVALGASFGVYSQYRATHAAAGCPYNYGNWLCVGTDNTSGWGEGMSAWACQTGAYGNTNTVKAHYAVYHSRANNHTYYGGIRNYDATIGNNYAYTWAWSGGTTVSGFSTLNTQIVVDRWHNNYVGFYASYGPTATYYGNAHLLSGGNQFRPSALPIC